MYFFVDVPFVVRLPSMSKTHIHKIFCVILFCVDFLGPF